ncbi:MAG TPA: alkaline phosphatase family protein [Polyangiaceae bacterium]|nr:alkaline phosphatase family protein [Polyangiaceae bacterium]
MKLRTALYFFGAAFTVGACGSAEQSDANPNAVGEVAAALSTDGGTAARDHGESRDRRTVTPIKHVVVIIGENRTFDHVYATYKPKRGEAVWNLLSRRIVNEDGSPGANFRLSQQDSAVDQAPDGYEMSPGGQKAYDVLPPPVAGGPTTPYLSSLSDAEAIETGLTDEYLPLLITGGTGLPTSGVPDTRIPNVTALPPGPFQLTQGTIKYDDYTGDPVHRFYQMWQQLDCSERHATFSNPSGCTGSLFPWVASTISTGSNGKPPPSPIPDKEGARSMGFYNVLQGDAPYFKYLADHFAMSDNFHQAIEGGTGANHVALGTGDAVYYSDGAGHATIPPTLNTENPDPVAGTNNYYTQDGYSGGTYSDCADESQPGVESVTAYLHRERVRPNCETGHYYLLNNYAPGYFGDGSVNSGQFAVPPSSVRNIGDALVEKNISWRYYGANWNRYLEDLDGNDPKDNYCDICNPFQYATSIMTNAEVRTSHIKDTTDLYTDIDNGFLPAFSIVKPDGLVDGHPSSSKLDLFEGFTKKIVDQIQAHPELWQETAVFVTFDEGGGYYDSGYVNPVDFFGDGTRIPMVAVSPWTDPGHISHDYSDHVSILKFVERNWGLRPLTTRSRDNLPNPRSDFVNPWVPRNGAAIDDLFDLFDFRRRGGRGQSS